MSSQVDSTSAFTGLIPSFEVAMSEYEKADLAVATDALAIASANLKIAEILAWASAGTSVATAVSAIVSIVIAVLMWRGIKEMARLNTTRAAQAAEAQKTTEGMLTALTELIRRTSPPSSQDGPRPGPAE